MKNEKSSNLKIAAYQGPVVEGDINLNIDTVMKILEQAEKEKVDILCMPECFLQGYFVYEQEAKKNAIDLDEPIFQNFLTELKKFKITTLIVGLNEKVENQLFNTAVVIENSTLTLEETEKISARTSFWAKSGLPSFLP